ncbi:unnamed protein product [Rhizoctonia solani]|uniref:DUF6535 domain-containing protein n=1 Tax=Rhizoctonia solani TaxID=456999 RepID=A0A8H3CGV9_9AGAM|nr:unnamed protein product [Rhizoctonia solani]
MSKAQLDASNRASSNFGLCCNNRNNDSADQSYDYKLGSDDPLWSTYLNEAEKWDDMMVNKWDKKMETLLLFAALFSAIVTAFVIESSQNLQPDNATITATAVVEIAALLRNRSVELPALQSPDEFQPSASAFIVNFVWFMSLCMSITVALLAGLVKQWCAMLKWDRTAPPCNQARIRQARLNKLKRWRTELVICALPVIMDAALCLFLLGLLVFLHELHYTIYLAALVITLFTMAFYFGTTLAPCFVSFCPYETAISSRKMWGYCYQLCLAIGIWICKSLRVFDIEMQADLTNYMSPCEKKEVEMASNTVPDQLTGDALNWIILHSQKPAPREMAIRAIATLESEKALKRLVSNPPGIIPQVIQSFTSRFRSSITESGVAKLELMGSIDTLSLHGRALTTLVIQALTMTQPDGHLARISEIQDPSETKIRLSKWVSDPTTQKAVRIRFEKLGSLPGDEVSEVRAWGLVGLSAWHDFTGHDKGLRFDRGKTVCRLAESLDWSLSLSLRTSVLKTLTKEFSYWTPSVVGEYRSKILSHLIGLIPTSPTVELTAKLACSLVVLTFGLNHGTTYPAVISISSSNSEAPDIEYPSNLPEVVAEYYDGRQKELLRDGQSLLLFALAGLTEYYEHCDFDKEAYENMKKVAAQFQSLDNLGKQQLITITTSKNVVITINPRAHFVNNLIVYLKQPRTPSRIQDLDEVFALLLKSINRKRQIWGLIEYGPQMIPLVVQILARTTNEELETQCLNTILSYWDSGPPLLFSRMLLFYRVPFKLVCLIKDRNQVSSPLLQPMISLVFRKLEEQARNFTHADDDLLFSCIGKILESDLLGILIVHVLNLSASSLFNETTGDSSQGSGPSIKSSLALLSTRELYKKTCPIIEREDNRLSPGELLLKRLFVAFSKIFKGDLDGFLAEKARLSPWFAHRESSITTRLDGMRHDEVTTESSDFNFDTGKGIAGITVVPCSPDPE